jgi:hypothetical protein
MHVIIRTDDADNIEVFGIFNSLKDPGLKELLVKCGYMPQNESPDTGKKYIRQGGESSVRIYPVKPVSYDF